MNILYLTNIFSDSVGGSEYVFWIYAKYMAKFNHNVYVICYKIDNESLLRLKSYLKQIKVFQVAPRITHRGTLLFNAKDNIKYILQAFKKCLQIMKSESIDIVHTNTYIPVFTGGLIKTLTKVPHVITVHDVASVMGLNFLKKWFKEAGKNAFPLINAFLSCAYEKLILTKVPKNAIITPSRQTKIDVKKMIHDDTKIYIVPNTIDIEQYKLYNEKIEYQPYILYIGRLIFYKNIWTLIKAFENIYRENNEAKLIIAGRGPLELKAREYVLKRGLTKKIKILGFVSQKEKMKLLSKCRALVNLSLFEGFGLTTLESWFFEKPVIVSNIPPLNEIVTHMKTGLTVDPFDIKKLSEYLNLILSDKKICLLLGRKGRQELLHRYSPLKVINLLTSIYNLLA